MTEAAEKDRKSPRNFPNHSLEDALVIAQKIEDEMGGRPFKRLLLAEALGIKPASSKYRALLSSSNKYGLTDGNERSSEIALTPQGSAAVQTKDASRRIAALRKAAAAPQVFGDFYSAYDEKKLPSPEMMRRLLTAEYKVPPVHTDDGANLIMANGRFAHIIRDIGGSPHVMLNVAEADALPYEQDPVETTPAEEDEVEKTPVEEASSEQPLLGASVASAPPRSIFIGHGKKRGPLEKLQKFLSSFQIPHKVVIDEANLGRPISQKVKQTMLECGSAILIFTCDEELRDLDGNTIWRPSENVVHELGAASFAYEGRVVIFKEKGIQFPTNFQSIGYIEFDEDGIESKTADLLKELIGFGLVRITTAG